MDAVTVFAIATLMMLANGGVLGLMHDDLAEEVRPAATSWRIATLLFAGGCVLFTVQRELPSGFVLPFANGLVMLGFTGYWRSLRQFYGLPDRGILLTPAAIGTVAIAWFAAVVPDVGARILVVSVVWATILVGCIRVLRSRTRTDVASSRRVMTGIVVTVLGFTVARALFFVVTGVGSSFSVIDAGSWMNVATPMIVATLPVVGTTAFLLMCSERIRRQWERAASTDHLTGLPNRRTLLDAGSRRFAEGLAGAPGLALALVDVDHFKSINDRYGHDVGDLALVHLAACLRATCGASEVPARHGGEEFVVLLAGVDEGGAFAAGERFRVAVAGSSVAAGERAIAITVSIGVAVQSAADRHFDDLLRRADEAMYRAKAEGRDRVRVAEGRSAVAPV